jgi:hypothetical protein
MRSLYKMHEEEAYTSMLWLSERFITGTTDVNKIQSCGAGLIFVHPVLVYTMFNLNSRMFLRTKQWSLSLNKDFMMIYNFIFLIFFWNSEYLTTSMELSNAQEVNSRSASREIGPYGSLPCSQQLATGYCAEPYQSSPHRLTLYFLRSLQYIVPLTTRFCK